MPVANQSPIPLIANRQIEYANRMVGRQKHATMYDIGTMRNAFRIIEL